MTQINRSTENVMRTSYLMENPNEAERIENKTELKETIHQLKLVGLQTGMNVLDAGTGPGTVACTMAHLVGPEGRVTGMDQSPNRIAYARNMAAEENLDNISFKVANIYEETDVDQYDLVWSRFVIEYLDQPDMMVGALIHRVLPGGKLVIGDLDNMGQLIYPITKDLEKGLSVLNSALSGKMDLYAGRKLYSRFRQAGLEDIKPHVLPYHVCPGRIPDEQLLNWEQKFEVIAPVVQQAFGGVTAYRAFVNEYMYHLLSEDVFMYGTLILMEGRRPAR
jgi:ubiquinone/menaquinone biosynthesis C-methylase UbiE